MFVHWPVLLVTLAASISSAVASDQTTRASGELRQRHAQLHARWANQAEQLAAKCESNSQSENADLIRQLIHPVTAELLSIPILPTNGQPSPSSVSTNGRAEWQVTLARLQKQHAKELFELAGSAFRAGDVTLCYDLMREVVEHDPDHGAARSLMGFTKNRDQWVSPYAAGKLRSGQIWDSRFGWILKSQLPHYEKGQELWKGQWLAAEEVAQYRQQWANAWEIETEHYVVRTDCSLLRGVQFAEKLEKLYAIFFRLFAGFFSPREQIGVLFDPPNRHTAIGKMAEPDRRPAKRFRVNFYRTKEEYLEALRPYVKSGLEISTGMYLTGTRTCYFYVHEQMDESTVIHEATHQLFSETREHRQGDGSRGNYWVMEGIAGYMESFRDCGNHVELGSWETPRLKLGRDRIMQEGKYTPIEKLVRLAVSDFDGPEIYALYAESACLCHFLMHHDNGRYRDALVSYLEEVYLGRADFLTLTQIAGTNYAELDRLFREHVARMANR